MAEKKNSTNKGQTKKAEKPAKTNHGQTVKQTAGQGGAAVRKVATKGKTFTEEDVDAMNNERNDGVPYGAPKQDGKSNSPEEVNEKVAERVEQEKEA